MDDYYSRTIEAVKEKLTPIEIDVKIYGPDSFLKAAEKESFDMSIASSGLTSLMIERTGGLPLAAVVSDEAPDPNYANGAAIIVRADRPELRTLEDLRGRSVAIMSRTAFAGWQIPASEMVRKGLDPEAFFSEIRVSGYPMTRIVQEVKSGEVDVGFVATCLLERMARGGQIDQQTGLILGGIFDQRNTKIGQNFCRGNTRHGASFKNAARGRGAHFTHVKPVVPDMQKRFCGKGGKPAQRSKIAGKRPSHWGRS